MRCAVIDHACWVPGGWEGLAADLRAGRSRCVDGEGIASEPSCPPGFPAAQWRRMSRLSRGAAVCVAALVARNPDVDWAGVPSVWGTSLGEVGASSTFLDRLHAEGPERASPLVFQGSVYNAAAGRLSVALGLRGPSETIAAGQATALAALARGVAWLARAERVLVFVGDERVAALQTALGRLGIAPGEGAVALLLGPGDALEVRDGLGGPRPWIGRAARLPYESEAPPPVDLVVEATLGFSAVGPLAALLALGQGTAVGADDGALLSAAWAQAVAAS